MYKLLTIIVFLAIGLSACTSRVDGRGIVLPEIKVDRTQAAVGEQITVTVTGGFANIGAALSPDFNVKDYRLGVCFGRDPNEPNAPVGGLCLNKDLPLPDYIVIAEGEAYQRAFGEQVIRSGEERVLEHSFSFTSTSPGLVTIFSTSQSFYETIPQPSIENTLGVKIVFE